MQIDNSVVTFNKFGHLPAYLRPSFKFSNRHFGHFSDMFQQAKDSALFIASETPIKDQQLDTGNLPELTPPVLIRFVTGTLNNEIFGREFQTIDEIIRDVHLSDPMFQSSNISNYATASLPFFDEFKYIKGNFSQGDQSHLPGSNEGEVIGVNVHRNRDYLFDEVTVE